MRVVRVEQAGPLLLWPLLSMLLNGSCVAAATVLDKSEGKRVYNCHIQAKENRIDVKCLCRECVCEIIDEAKRENVRVVRLIQILYFLTMTSNSATRRASMRSTRTEERRNALPKSSDDMAQIADKPSATDAKGCMMMAHGRWMMIWYQGVP